MNGLGRPSVRAVVYTRKSSEEGLEQEFNSLDGVVRQSLTHLKVPRSHKPMKRRFGTTP